MPAPKTPPSPPPPALPSHSPTRPQVSLQQSSPKKSRFKFFSSVFRSFPIINATCRMPPISRHKNRLINDSHIHGGGGKGKGKRVTGTLFGWRKSSRVNLVIQENPRCLPMLVLELSIPTGKLLQDMGLGLVRIALESEKHSTSSEKTKLVEEPIWTMYCNGLKTGYAVKREPTDGDLNVVQMLHAVSMGAGVLPGETTMMDSSSRSPDHGDQLTYVRAYFERVVGSKDSETYYMMNPDGKSSGPELIIFFVRI